jgi:hypothetical protein
VDAVEIENMGIDDGVAFYLPQVLAFWEDLLTRGAHATALGGSDDHSAGTYSGYGSLASPVGSPTTLVRADELSAAAILDAVRRGRTVVKLQGPADPMVEIESDVAGDERGIVHARSTHLHVRVSAGMQGGPPIAGGGAGGGGAGLRTVRIVHNGVAMDEIDATAEPFDATLDVRAPDDGEDRYRAEVLVDGRVRTITSHVFVRLDPNGPDPAGGTGSGDDGGCRQVSSGAPSTSTAPLAALVAAIALAFAKRSRRIL